MPPIKPLPKIAPVKVAPGKAPSLKQRKPLPEFLPAKDPLAKVQYPGNIEDDAAAELSAAEASFRHRMKVEQGRASDETDSENWFAVVFETRSQKEDFLHKVGLFQFGDKYLDSRDVAKVLKVDLIESGREWRS